MIIQSEGICSLCGQWHEKRLRIDTQGRIRVIREKNDLLRIGEPECILQMAIFNGARFFACHPDEKREFIFKWTLDMFLGRRAPKIQIETELDWLWYGQFAQQAYQARIATRPQRSRRIACRLIRNLFPKRLEYPPSVAEPIIKTAYKRIFANWRGKYPIQYPMNRRLLTDVTIETSVCLQAIRSGGDTISTIIAHLMTPAGSFSREWEISPIHHYFVQRFGQLQRARAAHVILQAILDDGDRRIWEKDYFNFVRFAIEAFRPIESAQPLIEAIRTRFRI